MTRRPLTHAPRLQSNKGASKIRYKEKGNAAAMANEDAFMNS